MTKDTIQNIHKIFAFLHKVEALKHTYRYNKKKDGNSESTAEHTWRLTLATFLFATELKLNLDINHAIKIALVHDLAESIAGDTDAWDVKTGKIKKEEKEAKELKAMHELKELLPDSLKDEIFNLWQEYEDCKTKEARYIKALDKIETVTQFVDVGLKNYDRGEFILSYPDKPVAKFPELQDVLDVLKEELLEGFKLENIDIKNH